MKKVLPLLWVPFGYLIGSLLGQGIYSALGYEAGTTNAPMWVRFISASPAFILIILGAVLAYKKRSKYYR